MTNETPAPEAQVPATVRPARTFVTVHSETALFDTAKFEQIARVAQAAYRSSFLPAHLTTVTENSSTRELDDETVKANCFIVASMAHDFGVGFMAMSQVVSQVHGKMMFEGKFIAALIEARLGIKLRYTYTGEPGTDSYGIKVWTAEDEARGYNFIEGTVGEWATKERTGGRKSIWVGANKQKMQLAYMGARVWARLNEPGLILGIYGADEFDDGAPIADAPAAPAITAGFQVQTPDAAGLGKQNPAPVMDSKDRPGLRVYTVATLPPVPAPVNVLVTDLAQDAAIPAGYEESTTAEDIAAGVRRLRPATVDEKPADKKKSSQKEKKANADKAPKVDEKTEDNARGPEGVHDGDGVGTQSVAAGPGNVAAESAAEGAGPGAAPDDGAEKARDHAAAMFRKDLKAAKTWAQIKSDLNTFVRLPFYRETDQAFRTAIKADVWNRISELNADAWVDKRPDDVVHPHSDPMAYSCAVEACEDAGVLEAVWAEFSESAVYKALQPGPQKQLQDATAARLALLKGAM